MAGYITDSLIGKLMDLSFNGTAYAGNATVYIKLHTGDPGVAAAAFAFGDTTRVAVTFRPQLGGLVTSDSNAEWTSLSADGTISHISLWDAATNGNPLWVGPLTTPRAVLTGDDFAIDTTDLTVTMDQP